MTMLVDAGPLVALLRARDQHHVACREALKKAQTPLKTVWPALTEAMYLLTGNPDAQDKLWATLERGAVDVLPLDATDMPRMRELMAKYCDRPMDLADAALVRAAEREGLDTVFTVDRADFGVYRINGKKRFKIVP
jgi:predicted nucleic acid-binding protein